MRKGDNWLQCWPSFLYRRYYFELRLGDRASKSKSSFNVQAKLLARVSMCFFDIFCQDSPYQPGKLIRPKSGTTTCPFSNRSPQNIPQMISVHRKRSFLVSPMKNMRVEVPCNGFLFSSFLLQSKSKYTLWRDEGQRRPHDCVGHSFFAHLRSQMFPSGQFALSVTPRTGRQLETS